MTSKPKPLRIGLVGAGIGGVAALISLKVHGGDDVAVTVLEAAAELGEIGAGIQMTPNVSRLLMRWGVAEAIGDNLVEFEEINLRRKDGRVVGHSKMRSREWCGWPWWLVHRMHLHDGLCNVAKRKGVDLIINAKVAKIDDGGPGGKEIKVKTEAGGNWTFDVLIGSDGLRSVVRGTILPSITPKPPTGNAAYRAIVPAEKIKADPLTKSLMDKSAIDVWMGAKHGSEHGYVISYPISAGNDFNMVLSHHRDYGVLGVEDVTMDEVKETFKTYDPRIRRAIELIDQPVKRWPLMVTRCPTWSNPQKTIVLMGDAAHSMVNHLAQGAATSMEDGAFLGLTLARAARGDIDLRTAVDLYEKERMPLADVKQQASYINGMLWHMQEDSPEAAARDRAMQEEVNGRLQMKSPNMFSDPYIWRTIYDYDPEAHALDTVEKYRRGDELRDATTHVTKDQNDIYVDWFMPETREKKAAAKL